MKIVDINTKIAARIDGGDNPISTERELWNIIRNESIKLFEIKCIEVNLSAYPSYIIDNFDNTGLGINDMEGFAICNGNNGTRDMSGRVMVSYGTGYADIGAIGGSKDAVLVEHSHKSVATSNPLSEYSPANKYTAAYRPSGGDAAYGLQGTSTVPTYGYTTTEGTNGADKNMQPYMVVLMIKRIA